MTDEANPVGCCKQITINWYGERDQNDAQYYVFGRDLAPSRTTHRPRSRHLEPLDGRMFGLAHEVDAAVEVADRESDATIEVAIRGWRPELESIRVGRRGEQLGSSHPLFRVISDAVRAAIPWEKR
jgi:hypothetical protein